MSTFVIVPIVMRQAPPVRRAVMQPLAKTFSMYLLAMGALTIIFGLVLVDRTPGREFGDLFANGWGWAIGLGLVTSGVAWLIGLMTGRAGKKMGALGNQIGDGPPSPEQAAEMSALTTQLKMLSRAATLLVIIAVGSMAVARWV